MSRPVFIQALAGRWRRPDAALADRPRLDTRARTARPRDPRITEKAVLTAVGERLRDPASIRYVLERVEAEVQLLHAHLPEEIQVKRAALVAEEQRIANYISFIGEGKGTRALGEALKAAE